MLNGFKSPGKIALIGSNSEIGLSILKQLPKDPAAQTILVGRTGEYAVDVTVKEQRHAIVEKLFADGDLDIVIVAVGVLGNNPKLDEGENLLVAMEVNYTGTVHLLHLLAERMQKAGHGKILVISSFAQVRPRLDLFGYGSTKAGLDFYCRGLADKLRGTGVSLKILRPGFVKSKMTEGLVNPPLSITSEVCGKYGVKALNSRGTVTWAPSPLRYVAFIFKILPGPLYRMVADR